MARDSRLLVPQEGLEPPHPCGYQILSLTRLPFRHWGLRRAKARIIARDLATSTRALVPPGRLYKMPVAVAALDVYTSIWERYSCLVTIAFKAVFICDSDTPPQALVAFGSFQLLQVQGGVE